MKISALLLTEDGSKFAVETLGNVCAKIFDFIVPQCSIAHVRFHPISANERDAMTANRWRSTNPRDYSRLLSLCESIATQLLRADGFVFFHFDGDVIWDTHSATLTKYEDRVVRRVREIVRGKLQKPDGADCSLAVDSTMGKLIHVVPYYSIESWLFANTQTLRERCIPSVEVEARIQAWQLDLAQLDGVTKPKDLARIDTAHYPELATKLPTERLIELETSFCATVLRTGRCAPLVVRLRHAWPDYIKQQYGLR